MKNQALVSRYTGGLVLALADDAEYARVESELRGLVRLFEENAELRRMLDHPLLPAGRKSEICGDILDRLSLSDKTRRFVLLLMEHGRPDLLTDILELLPRAWAAKKGIISYEATSAVPLDEGRKRKLAAALERLEGAPVRLTYDLDPAVLGGLRVRKGHLVYDASIRGGLERLRENILEG
ncbi:MAG: ATP synthase F1 subunit delta [Candidatus Aminicenantes bacterium]|nr:ATP synthase F1 subunit delta [Candidatus Aminicenantes bacterium]